MLASLRRSGAVLVNVGHGRDPLSAARAAAFVAAWQDVGQVGLVVSWPAVAASWLRPARRLVSGAPDAWVVADSPEGWAGLSPRLASTPGWRADRTFVFPGLPEAPRRFETESRGHP